VLKGSSTALMMAFLGVVVRCKEEHAQLDALVQHADCAPLVASDSASGLAAGWGHAPGEGTSSGMVLVSLASSTPATAELDGVLANHVHDPCLGRCAISWPSAKANAVQAAGELGAGLMGVGLVDLGTS
jgi:hypothetical protein